MKIHMLITGLVLALALTVSECVKAEGLYLTLGAGENGQFWSQEDNWDDGNGTGAFIALSYRWDKQWWCFGCYPLLNYAHISQWDDDGYGEDWVDHIGVAATWQIFERRKVKYQR